jgi:hypothetical protein
MEEEELEFVEVSRDFRPLGFWARIGLNIDYIIIPGVVLFLLIYLLTLFQVSNVKSTDYSYYSNGRVNLLGLFFPTFILSIFICALIILPLRVKKLLKQDGHNGVRIKHCNQRYQIKSVWLKYWLYIGCSSFVFFIFNFMVLEIDDIFSIVTGSVFTVPLVVLISHLVIPFNKKRQSLIDWLFGICYEKDSNFSNNRI